MSLRNILAALVASAALMATTVVTAAPYKMVGWYQRSGGGRLSSLMFKAGAAQGCPGTSYTQPCFNGSGSVIAPPGAVWVTNNGVATAIISAGQPTWDWTGGVMTMTGLLWAGSAIDSNPNGSIVISDKFTNFTINTNTSNNTAGVYNCVEGTFLATVGANGCLNVELGTNAALDSTVTYNVSADATCIDRTVVVDDVDTGNPRGVKTAAAGGLCDAVDGSIDYYNIIPNPRFLILANAAAIVVSAGDCYMFGRNGLAPGATAPNGPCDPAVPALAGVSYFVFAPDVDTDSDGVIDALDNCRLLSNANQADSDGDGYGNRCDADMNNNGAVNAQDTSQFRTLLGSTSTAPTYHKADLNANGAVNAQDTSIFRTLLGAPPGPSGLCVNSLNAPVFPCPPNP